MLESGHKSSGRLAFRFVLEDMWLKPTVFVLESDHICAGRFVLKSARKSSRILSIRAWRFVAESEHVRGGILGHSWQKRKWLNPIRSWIGICSSRAAQFSSWRSEIGSRPGYGNWATSGHRESHLSHMLIVHPSPSADFKADYLSFWDLVWKQPTQLLQALVSYLHDYTIFLVPSCCIS